MTITQTKLTEGQQGSYPITTASVSPSANKLLLFVLVGYNSTLPTLSGCGVTWVNILQELDGQNNAGVNIYRAMGTPTTGSITTSGGSGGGEWALSEFGNVDTSGTDGSGAVLQVLGNRGNDPTQPSQTLAALAAGSATFGAIGNSGNLGSDVWTPGSGYTKIADQTDPAFLRWLQTEWRSDGQTTVDFSYGGTHTVHWAIAAVEIKAAPAPTNMPITAAAETDTARGLTLQRKYTIAAAEETNSAQTISLRKLSALTPATETDTAQPVTLRRIYSIGTAYETDSAQPVTIQKLMHISSASEIDTSQPVRIIYIGRKGLVFSKDLSGLGCGEYQCFITRRGGGPVVLEVAFTQITGQLVLNNAGQVTVTVPTSSDSSASACCEVFNETLPWRDEILIYRGNDIAFVGPIVNLETSGNSGTIIAQDLFYWTERRFLEHNLHSWGDDSETFRRLFEAAIAPDPSPNIRLITHPTGVASINDYKGTDFHRIADLLRELARTSLDFTTIGRTVYAGGEEVFTPQSRPFTPLLLHDDGVASKTITKDGLQFATDIVVFAGSADHTGKSRTVPLIGRARRESEEFGLVQQVATELLLASLDAVNNNAVSRLNSMQPAPLRVKATLSPEADFEFKDLIPGRRIDSRLSGCIDVMDTMRLTTVSFRAGAGVETIEIDVVPLGMIESGLLKKTRKTVLPNA